MDGYSQDLMELGGEREAFSDEPDAGQRELSDRRTAERLGHGEDGARDRATIDPSEKDVRYFIPQNWPAMAIFMAAAYLAAGAAALSLPSAAIIVTALVSIAIFALGGKFAHFERHAKLSRWARKLVLVTSVMLPCFLAGLVMAGWTHSGLSWQWAVATLICLNAIAATLLSNRIVSLFASKFATWTAFAVVDASLSAIGAIIATGITLTLIARYQWKIELNKRVEDQARERVRMRAEDILRDYEETGQGWFWETDRRGQISYISQSAARVLGKQPTELVGLGFTEMFELGIEAREGERTLTFHLSARSSFKELAVRAAVHNEERWWSISGRPVYDSFKNFCGFRGSGTDLTEKRRSQQNESRLAHYDSLTGLANRFQMSQTLEKILAAPLPRDRECSVFLLDLDRFKQVNDTMGHPAGDALLKQVSSRLERTVGDSGRVGRLGGDEFKVILPGRFEREALAQLASDIISSLSQPYSVDGQAVIIGASIGIALCPDDGDESETLIRNADLALYAAKDGGRGRYHFFSDNLHSAAKERAKLEQDLRDALHNENLELFYQPVICAASEHITGFEALLRWNHPEQGWLSPASFVPIAEDAGLIEEIGCWALQVACRDLARWPEEIRCAVNVSPLQFANPELPDFVARAISQAGINPARLELEITESVFLNEGQQTDLMFAALKKVGVRLALDDFGTGYSSLGYLKKAPFDKIKIDQSFVRGATEAGSRNGAIITSITSLAQALGMDTTAEGVETLDELELVRALGCSHIQGHIYAAALPEKRASELVVGDLKATASGPRSARAPRQSLLRKVVLEHNGEYYSATIRNLSISGALVEGLWNVPAGLQFAIAISEDHIVSATSRWSEDNRTGMEFSLPLERDEKGRLLVLSNVTDTEIVMSLSGSRSGSKIAAAG